MFVLQNEWVLSGTAAFGGLGRSTGERHATAQERTKPRQVGAKRAKRGLCSRMERRRGTWLRGTASGSASYNGKRDCRRHAPARTAAHSVGTDRSRRSVATSLGECCTTSLPPSAPSQHPSSLDETTTLGADSVTTLERPVATSLGDCCTTSLPPAAPSQHSSSLDETTALGARSATTLERPATKALPFRSDSGKRGAGRGLGQRC